VLFRSAAVTLACAVGTHYWKAYWDPAKGDKYTPTPEDVHALAQFSQADAMQTIGDQKPLTPTLPAYLANGKTDRFGRQTYTTGMPVICTVSMTEVGFQPGFADIKDCGWCFHRTLWSMDKLHDQFPEKAWVCQPDVYGTTDVTTALANQTGSYNDRSQRYNMAPDTVTVWEYFEKPSMRFPDGRTILCTRDVCLLDVPFLPGGRLPFSKMVFNPIDGRHHGLGLSRLIAPQLSDLNDGKTSLSRIAQLAGGVILAVPEGSQNGGAVQVTQADFQILPMDFTKGRPMQLGVNPNPMHQVRVEDDRKTIQELSRLSEVIMGSRVPSGISGRTVNMLENQVAKTLGPFLKSVWKSLADIYEVALGLWAEYAPPLCTVRVLGRDGALEAAEIAHEDLNHIRFRFDESTLDQRSSASKGERLMMALQAGVMNMQPDVRRAVLRALEFGDIAELDDGGAKAKREAQKIKYWLMNFDRMLPEVQAGVVPNARDVHTGAMATILKELDEYTYDADYANRPEAHPRFEWYMAWGDYQTRMVQNGIMWYSPQLKPVLGQLPPDAVPPPPAPPQQPQQSAPAVDAYGQPQGEQPQQPNTLLTPDVMAQYQMAQQQMGARGMDNTQQPNEAQPAGPGVGGLDTIASR